MTLYLDLQTVTKYIDELRTEGWELICDSNLIKIWVWLTEKLYSNFHFAFKRNFSFKTILAQNESSLAEKRLFFSGFMVSAYFLELILTPRGSFKVNLWRFSLFIKKIKKLKKFLSVWALVDRWPNVKNSQVDLTIFYFKIPKGLYIGKFIFR